MVIRILCLMVLLLLPLRSTAQGIKKDAQIGFFVEAIHDIDYQDGSYQIIIWLWINSTEGKFDFSQDLFLDNCVDVEISGVFYDSAGSNYHSECKINATIINQFNVKNFPFDKQKVLLGLDLTDLYEYNFTLDTNSKLRPESVLGWRLDTSFAQVRQSDYNSNFGNYLSDERLVFHGLDLELILSRDAWSLFFKSFLTLFIAILLASLSLFFPNRCSEEKTGLIVGSLFTVVGNKYFNDGNLPLTIFNLSDKLHLFTIAMITGLTLYAVIEQRLRLKDNYRTDKFMFLGFNLFFFFGVLFFVFAALR